MKSGSAKKHPKRVTTKSTMRSKTTKAVVPEKPVALYQSDDYFGSFSDEDDYDAYVAPIDDEDDIVEASSPKPKAWPPLRSAQERVQVRPQANENIGEDSNERISNQLHLQLITLRQQVSKIISLL